eukprot:1204298-Pleurochrysis_carterae.AAC.1
MFSTAQRTSFKTATHPSQSGLGGCWEGTGSFDRAGRLRGCTRCQGLGRKASAPYSHQTCGPSRF